MPNEPPAQPGTAPPPGKKFPCVQCGARLDFDPGVRSLRCPYCGHVEKIDPENEVGVVEHDFEEYLARQHEETAVAGRTAQVKCNTCGAVVLLEERIASDRCPYCASFLQNEPEKAKAMVPPEGILPFRIDNRQAFAAFTRWLHGLWFAPNAIKQFAHLGQLTGVYVPFWTFDSMTFTYYRGERGDNYQVPETYTATETYMEDGQTKMRTVTRTRMVTRIHWYPVAGEVQHFFDDVAVSASEGIPDRYTATLSQRELKGVVPFRAEYLSGFTTERYAIGPKEGFTRAKDIMDGEIRRLCMRDIGGDHQRLHTVRTQHVGVTFKHLLLPVWLASYRFRDQSYRVMVNAQTGNVMGDRPYSVAKIIGLIAAIVGIILAVVLLLALLAGSASGASRSQRSPPKDWVAQAVARPGGSVPACIINDHHLQNGVAGAVHVALTG